MSWTDRLNGDPLPWLLEAGNPAVRASTLQRLCARPADDPDVVQARAAAVDADPIRAILAAQDPAGWWSKPGPGYSPKYTGTVWQLIFLDQLGADPGDERIARACDYVLTWCPTASGGLGCSGSHLERPPPPSAVLHCLNGNLLRALIGFGRLDDPRVRAAVDWAASRITGEGVERWYASGTNAAGFCCAANEGQPCAWGAVKELRGLARIPPRRRSPLVRAAIEQGVAFLLSRDPSTADYPMGYGNTRPSASWFRLGFPSGYVTDVLQVLEVLSELGRAGDPHLTPALDWLVGLQDGEGRWRNRYAYNGKTTVTIERQGDPSKWVTLRACCVLKAAST